LEEVERQTVDARSLDAAGIYSTSAIHASARRKQHGREVRRSGCDSLHDNGMLQLDRAIPASASRIEVDDSTRFTFIVSYFFPPNVANRF
jgi:hypothetical protein